MRSDAEHRAIALPYVFLSSHKVVGVTMEASPWRNG